jgi:hypothetical protein
MGIGHGEIQLAGGSGQIAAKKITAEVAENAEKARREDLLGEYKRDDRRLGMVVEDGE